MTITEMTFREPLDGLDRARLEILGGAPEGLRLAAATDPALLAEGAFAHPGTQVTRAAGTLTVRTRHGLRGRGENILALGTRANWEIAVAGGVAEAEIDLRGLAVGDLAIAGGIARAQIAVGRPGADLRLRLSGGVEALTITRPAGVPARIALKGGAERVSLDGQLMGEGMAALDWRSDGDAAGTSGVTIEIAGGAEALTLAADRTPSGT